MSIVVALSMLLAFHQNNQVSIGKVPIRMAKINKQKVSRFPQYKLITAAIKNG